MFALPVTKPAPLEVRPGAGRGRHLLAWAYDCGTLVLGLAIGFLAAVVWMLARTEWGRVDLGSGDSAVALALAVSAGPAWTAWQWSGLWAYGGTSGYRRMGAAASMTDVVMPARGRRAAALALHPVSVPLWGWTTCALLATGAPMLLRLASLPLATALLVALLALGSLVLLLLQPAQRPLHRSIAYASFGGRR